MFYFDTLMWSVDFTLRRRLRIPMRMIWCVAWLPASGCLLNCPAPLPPPCKHKRLACGRVQGNRTMPSLKGQCHDLCTV